MELFVDWPIAFFNGICAVGSLLVGIFAKPARAPAAVLGVGCTIAFGVSLMSLVKS